MKILQNFQDLEKEFDKKVVRRFLDMKDKFENSKGVKGNPVLYVVYIKDFGTFEVGLTVIRPGNINREFYMTKGHKHKKAREEIYILTSGKGKLLIQGKESKVIDMKKDKFYVIPNFAGHRAINTGKENLKFLSIYAKDSGHDYNFKFKKRFFKK